MPTAYFSNTTVIVVIGGGIGLALIASLVLNRLVKYRQRREYRRILSDHSARRYAPASENSPSFGYFAHVLTGQPTGKPERPFTEAAEFTYRNQQVLFFRHIITNVNHRNGEADYDHVPYRVVQIRTPESPTLIISRRNSLQAWRPAENLSLTHIDRVGDEAFDSTFAVFCSDERLAYRVLNPDVRAWLTNAPINAPIFIGNGVISYETYGEFDASIVPVMDLLLDFAQRIIPTTWPDAPPVTSAPSHSQQQSPSRRIFEKISLALVIVGTLPLIALLLILGSTAFINATGYFFGSDSRILFATEKPWLSLLSSGWYGPFNSFGTALQSWLFGLLFFGLPVFAAITGAIRVRRKKTASSPSLPSTDL